MSDKKSVKLQFDTSRRTRICSIAITILFCLYTGMAVYFNGFSMIDFLIILGLFAAAQALLLIKFKLPGIVKGIIVLIIPAIAFVLMESMTHNVFDTMKFDAVLLNLAFFYLFVLFLFFITGSSKRALIISLIVFNVIGAANYFVILFRSSPILPWDLLSVGTAMEVAGSYRFEVTWQVADICAAFLLCIIAACKTTIPLPEFGKGLLKQILIRAAACCVLLIPSYFYINLLFDPDIADYTSLDNTLFTPKYMYKTNGFFVAFIMDARYMKIDSPTGYSAKEAQETLDSYEVSSDTPDELPNVIVIMDECFSDIADVAEINTNMEYMPYINSLLAGADNTISGRLYVSVLGGNTANTEYEFLTGNSMAFLPKGSIPYQQYISSDTYSCVDIFNSLGYKTVGMHPYAASGWNRNKVYQYFHFDEMLFQNDFKDKEYLRKNRVSDKSDFDNVLDIYNNSDEPVFIFNVTMQNHSPFGKTEEYNFVPDVTAEFKNAASRVATNNYLSLMKKTDEAVEYLLGELSKSDKPTIVVFFGDHQPNDFIVAPIYTEYGMDIDNQTLEEQQHRQKVPFFIWANYDIEEESGLSLSANFLSSKLFEAAGLPLSSYQQFLAEVSESIPVINALGYMSTDGTYHYLDDAEGETENIINEYNKLEYYMMFDKAYN